MTRSISYVGVCTCLLWALAVPSRAAAEPFTVDQQNVGLRAGGFGVSGDMTLAQTFTVGITGFLTQLDLGIFNPNDTTSFPDPLTIQLRGTSGGAPNANVLFTWTLPVVDVPQDRNALTSLVSPSLGVFAGQRLAIVLTTGNHGNYGWSYVCCYNGGEAFIYGGGDSFVPSPNHVAGDFIFRTYVDPQQAAATPEPATLILLVLGLGAVSMGPRLSSRLSRGCSTRSTGLP